ARVYRHLIGNQCNSYSSGSTREKEEMNSEALCGIQRLLPSFLVSHDKNITAGSFIFLLRPAPLYLEASRT
ncbi:hypothetical protein, partial [Escherichia coli]|uniref:hypothetical protein n=2 Tax=Escherichia coli TaxID=562 RepID=UPI0022A75208